MSMGTKVHCFQDTFWNKKRVEAGIKLTELAQQFHVSDSAVSTWLTGQIMPKDSIISQFCDLFDVDFPTGHTEFYKAHQAYEALERMGSKSVITHEGETNSLSVQNEEVDIFKAVYGKLSYEEFRAFITACANKDADEAIKYVYGKVSYSDFMNITDMLKGDAI